MNLQEKIEAKRREVQLFIAKHSPRQNLMARLALVFGVLATVLAGIPALGGKAALEALKVSWQPLCVAASSSSLIATLVGLLRGNSELPQQLSIAKVCDAKLEILAMQLAEGHIEGKDALSRFGEYTAELSFLRA